MRPITYDWGVTLLHPWAAAVAAAITIPLLVLLYFLKLRRRHLRIASTLLWRHSFEDLQVNAPFQRLRWSLLLFLQLLALLLFLFAFAQPRIQTQPGPSSRVILLIDHSASMNVVQDATTGVTRLDAAKTAATEIINRLTRASAKQQIMIVAFAAQPHVVRAFSSRRRELLETMDSIQPTDEQADLQRALQLAGAFARVSDDPGEQPPDVILISDGGVAPPELGSSFSLRAGGFRFVNIDLDNATPVNNVGIAAFSARRDYDDPARILIYARLVNASSEAVRTLVTLDVDNEPAVQRAVPIPAASDHSVGEAALSLSLDLSGPAVLRLRHHHADQLEADDVAALVMPQPRRPRIAIVHPGDGADPFLEEFLLLTEPDALRIMSGEAFDQISPEELDTAARFDLIVFDRVSPERLPGVSTLSFGGVPAGLTTTPAERAGGSRFLSWHRQHPVMRYVSLDTIRFAGFGAFELPTGAMSLAYGPDGPVIALLRTRQARHIVVGFALRQSNWPVHFSFTVFLQNVLDFLSIDASSAIAQAASTGQSGLAARPGEPIPVRASPNTDELVITGPESRTVPAEPGRLTTLPTLRRAGLYHVEGAEQPMNRLALSVLSEVESDIRPRNAIEVNAASAAAATVAAATPQELWPWLVGAALTIITIEWIIYTRRLAA